MILFDQLQYLDVQPNSLKTEKGQIALLLNSLGFTQLFWLRRAENHTMILI